MSKNVDGIKDKLRLQARVDLTFFISVDTAWDVQLLAQKNGPYWDAPNTIRLLILEQLKQWNR